MAKHKATKIENRLVRLLKEKILLFVVFITGACVLVIESVATRILAPFFGNTIYSVSSIIGVVLAALSFGYYLAWRFGHSIFGVINLASITEGCLLFTAYLRTPYRLYISIFTAKFFIGNAISFCD